MCVCVSSCVQFTRAVEMKQVAEQEAERAKFVVQKAEQVCRIQPRSRMSLRTAVEVPAACLAARSLTPLFEMGFAEQVCVCVCVCM